MVYKLYGLTEEEIGINSVTPLFLPFHLPADRQWERYSFFQREVKFHYRKIKQQI
jgi:hypothetical protein